VGSGKSDALIPESLASWSRAPARSDFLRKVRLRSPIPDIFWRMGQECQHLGYQSRRKTLRSYLWTFGLRSWGYWFKLQTLSNPDRKLGTWGSSLNLGHKNSRALIDFQLSWRKPD
jgi:hypothetical protein